ncbi:MAG: RNA 2',3'-cyclic phosphodiesterase [Candidatus Moraniibacteriota bacterium]
MHYRRVFVGIPISQSFGKRIIRKMESWQHLPIRFGREENFHVTLAFLGLVKDDDLPSICEDITDALRETESFDMSFNEIKLTPKGGDEAKMLWLTGEPSEGLAKLRNALEASLSSFDPEYKTFVPHITLGRVLRTRWARLPERPDIHESVNLAESVSGVTLYESVSENGKRKYIPLAEFSLL